MMGAVFQRTSCMLSLLHAKKLLAIHGYESFTEYIRSYFNVLTPKKKNIPFVKMLKETEEYRKFDDFLDESQSCKNHPKLKKLAEILIAFFTDPIHANGSKVIVFSQFRASAKEIKKFLDMKTEGLVKSEIFVG